MLANTVNRDVTFYTITVFYFSADQMLLTANKKSLLSRREEVHFTLTGTYKRPLDAIFTLYARVEKKEKQFADLTKSLDVDMQHSQGQKRHCVLIIGFAIYPYIQLSFSKVKLFLFWTNWYIMCMLLGTPVPWLIQLNQPIMC